MSDDLLKRLRKWWEYDNGRLFENAITHIEQLTAERDHAWEMVAKADTQVGQSLVDRLQDKAQIDRLREALDKAEGENSRLRNSLTGIKRTAAHRMQNDPKDLHSYYFHTARAALKGETT